MQPSRSYQVGASTLSLVFGDITSSNADVLVSSDDCYLTMGGGVSAAIRRAAGESLLLEVAKKVPATVGEVVVTGAGSMKAKHIFHAITIGRGQPVAEDIVASTTRHAIRLLKALGLSSIAFPAIGAGVAGIPYEEVAAGMASTLVEELGLSPQPLSVTIYLFDRYGRMQPIDYVRFFEEMASRTRGLGAKLPKPRALKPPIAKKALAPNRKPAQLIQRSQTLAALADLDKERQSLEGRLAQYGAALTRTEVRKSETRLKEIQQERVRLLSTVSTQPSKSVSVFVSYSHVDEALRAELGKHLSVLERQGIISTWHDRMISAGSEWEGAITAQLDEARVILLLISSDFIQSKYCYDVEMTRALERHDRREALVVPIILRAVSLKGTPFAKLQALPRDAKPVVTWADRDIAFVDITDSLRNTIQDLVGAA